MAQPEVWLRGPLPGYAPQLQPVAHALLQVREDLARVEGLAADRLEARVGASASIGYHLRHLCGSLDRLCTYARGEALSEEQLAALREEAEGTGESVAALVGRVYATLDAALEQVRATRESTLDDDRAVGRARLPATVRGLLFHAAEHSTRHLGQALTLRRVLEDSRG